MATPKLKRQTNEQAAQGHADASAPHPLSIEERHKRIAETAYFLSQQRAAEGASIDDVAIWLEAERSIDQQVAASSRAGHQHG